MEVMNFGAGRSVQIGRYLEMMRNFENSPVETFSEFAALSIELNEMYRLACEELRSVKLSQKTFEAQQRAILSRRGDTNPLTLEGISINKTNVDAFIRNLPDWQALQERIDELLDEKLNIQGVKEVIHACMTYISHNQLLKARAETNSREIRTVVTELVDG